MNREHGVDEMKEFRTLKTLDIQGIEPNGGGALSSNVSKLGSKEVSKICHLERSERSQRNEILRLSPQNDNVILSSPLEGEEAVVCDAKRALQMQVRGENKIAQQVRDDKLRHAELVSASHNEMVFSRFTSHFSRKRVAFTLAEVLITLGIIGVVASLTLPSIVHNVQKVVLKNQFKRAYSNFYNAIKYVQAKNGAPYACYYWDKRPYENCVCSRYNEYGSCIDWSMADGSPVPDDYNGKFSDCKKFTEDLMKALNVVKFCEKNALANGCVTNNFRGVDKILAEQNPDIEADPNQTFSDTSVKQKYPVFITADGVLYSKNYNLNASPVFVVDVNGHKGPNKWGYDIFSFTINGDDANGITKIRQKIYVVEKGGMTIDEILSGKK